MSEQINSFAEAKEALRGVLANLRQKQVVHYGATSCCGNAIRLWCTDDERRHGPGWNILSPNHQHNPTTGTIITNRTIYLPEPGV